MSVPMGFTKFLHIAANGDLAADPDVEVTLSGDTITFAETADPLVYVLTPVGVGGFSLTVSALNSDGVRVSGFIADAVTSPAATALSLSITDAA